MCYIIFFIQFLALAFPQAFPCFTWDWLHWPFYSFILLIHLLSNFLQFPRGKEHHVGIGSFSACFPLLTSAEHPFNTDTWGNANYSFQCISILNIFEVCDLCQIREWMRYFISYISRWKVTSKPPWFSLYTGSTSPVALHTGETNFWKNLSSSQNSKGVKLRHDCSEHNPNVFLANIKPSFKGEKFHFCHIFAIRGHILTS